MTDNLTLWQSVEKTDPRHVKAISGKPYKGSSPKPHFIIHEATRAFGPCGIGWGFKIISERVEDGATGDKVHIAHIQVWYLFDGKRGEIEHVGQTMFAGKNKNGPFTDEDAPKKSVTDALIKALSMIGFAGDIFMGRYDDSKYVDELNNEFAPAKAPKKTAPSAIPDDAIQTRYADEFTQWLNQADDLAEVRQVWRREAASRKDLGINGTEIEIQLNAAWKERGAALARLAGNPNAP